MKRVGSIKVNGKSGLDIEFKVIYKGEKSLPKTKQEEIFQEALNSMHRVALGSGCPHYSINVTDLTIR